MAEIRATIRLRRAGARKGRQAVVSSWARLTRAVLPPCQFQSRGLPSPLSALPGPPGSLLDCHCLPQAVGWHSGPVRHTFLVQLLASVNLAMILFRLHSLHSSSWEPASQPSIFPSQLGNLLSRHPSRLSFRKVSFCDAIKVVFQD